ncbi:MAG: hypothetical protein J6S14_11935 [Clostridia bacterium]|nr:hypothetical protein [Clostridia bacterium]
MFARDYCFSSKNVVSVSACCDDPEIALEIRKSDYIRAETFRRCFEIASYKYKPLRWKNKYYDHFHDQVMRELKAAGALE